MAFQGRQDDWGGRERRFHQGPEGEQKKRLHYKRPDIWRHLTTCPYFDKKPLATGAGPYMTSSRKSWLCQQDGTAPCARFFLPDASGVRRFHCTPSCLGAFCSVVILNRDGVFKILWTRSGEESQGGNVQWLHGILRRFRENICERIRTRLRMTFSGKGDFVSSPGTLLTRRKTSPFKNVWKNTS